MSDENVDRYLWDGSGDPDPGSRPVGRDARPAAPPAARRRSCPKPRPRSGRSGPYPHPGRARGRPLLAVAADLVRVRRLRPLVVGRCSQLAGTPVIDGTGDLRARPVSRRRRRLETDGGSRARLVVGHIGQVDVDPNTRVQLVEARGREHRMSLERRHHSRANLGAAEVLLRQHRGRATAIDLGCAYTLQVDADGSGLLRVTHGWVGFERDGREAFIPQGAMCATRRRRRARHAALRGCPVGVRGRADDARLRAGRDDPGAPRRSRSCCRRRAGAMR